MSGYIGDYNYTFSTDLASMIQRELKAEDPEHREARLGEVVRALERHRKRLEENPPDMEGLE
jgi:hypothetical protein